MAMVGGDVVVHDDETHAGSGLALALYLARKAAAAPLLVKLDPVSVLASMPRLSQPGMEDAKAATVEGLVKARLDLLRGLADDANVLGPAIVGYVQEHAEVSLDGVRATVATSASVGRLPDLPEPGAPIDGPEAAVALPVTGESGATALGVK